MVNRHQASLPISDRPLEAQRKGGTCHRSYSPGPTRSSFCTAVAPTPRLSVEGTRGQELNQTFCCLLKKKLKALIQSSHPLSVGRDPLLSQKALRGGNLLICTWQDPRPGPAAHTISWASAGSRRVGGDGLGCQACYPSSRTGRPPGCLSRKERPRAPQAPHGGYLVSASHPPALYSTAQSPGPWASLDRTSQADNKRHLI